MKLCEQCGFEKDGILCSENDCIDPRMPSTEALLGTVPAYYPARNEQTCPWCHEQTDNLIAVQCIDLEVELVCATCEKEYNEYLRSNGVPT